MSPRAAWEATAAYLRGLKERSSGMVGQLPPGQLLVEIVSAARLLRETDERRS